MKKKNSTHPGVYALDVRGDAAAAVVHAALVNVRTIKSVSGEPSWTTAATEGAGQVLAVNQGILGTVRSVRETFIDVGGALGRDSVLGPPLIADTIEGGALLNTRAMATQLRAAGGTIHILSGAVNALVS